MEKNLKNNIYIYSYPYIYGYIYLNHFAVHLKLTQYCKSTVVQLEKKKEKRTEGEIANQKNWKYSERKDILLGPAFTDGLRDQCLFFCFK